MSQLSKHHLSHEEKDRSESHETISQPHANSGILAMHCRTNMCNIFKNKWKNILKIKNQETTKVEKANLKKKQEKFEKLYVQ